MGNKCTLLLPLEEEVAFKKKSIVETLTALLEHQREVEKENLKLKLELEGIRNVTRNFRQTRAI